MKTKDIESLVDRLNSKNTDPLIFLSSLTDTIEIAKVWHSLPKGDTENEKSQTFYVVKNDKGVYVAAVMDMKSDLHFFVKKKYRKQGFLTRAMKQVVFPHLYQGGRERQSITFRDSQIGIYVEKNLGFEVDGQGHASIDLSEYKNACKLTPRKRRIKKVEYNQIKNKIALSRSYILMAADQFESSLGEENARILRSTSDTINALHDKILDIIERNQDRFDT